MTNEAGLEFENMETGLRDKFGEKILVGNVVHWTDGGDHLSLEERIKDRWDRIAVVSKKGILPHFTVVDSPSERTKQYGHCFCYGNFIYKDTENYLTVVASGYEEYLTKFKSAGDCMRYVLEKTDAMLEARKK